jgi:hypothetical protein
MRIASTDVVSVGQLLSSWRDGRIRRAAQSARSRSGNADKSSLAELFRNTRKFLRPFNVRMILSKSIGLALLRSAGWLNSE